MIKFSNDLIDEVAKALYHNEAGLTDECYEETMGKPRKLFNKPPMVFVPPEYQYWLEEHERDEYRWQAMVVVQLLVDKKLLTHPKPANKEDL